MRYIIQHQTQLDYSSFVNEHQCEMRFTPRTEEYQRVHQMEISVDPHLQLFEYEDAFGNHVHHFSLLEPHDRLKTNVRIEVESTLENPFNYPLMDPQQETLWYDDMLKVSPSLWNYISHRSAQTQTLPLNAIGVPTRDRQKPVLSSLLDVMEWVSSYLTYETGSTSAHSSLQEVINQRAGVCQDFAHLMISIARSWGLAARYVMGYQAPMKTDHPHPTKLSSHAWADVYIPGAGWRGFDATCGLVANDLYIPVAVGRDSLDAAPQRGSYKGPGQSASPEIQLMIVQHNQ